MDSSVNVLITGGGGFIGSHLVESQLGKGQHVRAVDLNVDRLDSLAGEPNLEIITGDITDAGLVARLVEGIDIAYHLASTHLAISAPDERYRAVNVGATEQLLRAAHAAGVKRVVHCSTVGVFGDVDNPPADETAPCRPNNIYDRTKLEGERAALRLSKQSGLPVVVARPAWVYGPGCPRTRKLMRSIKKRRFVMVGRGRTLRHPIYVLDAVRGLELCAATDGAAGQVYIIAGQQPVTINMLVRTVAGVVDAPPPALRLPVTAAKVAGVALELAFKPLRREPPFSRRSVDFFLRSNAFDTTKAQRELGFQACIGLREGLTQTWRWVREQDQQSG